MKADNSTNERLRALSDGYEAPYSEGAWEQMEQLLPPPPPDDDARGFFNFKMILGMITFFVLLLLGLQLWSPLNDLPPPPAKDAVSTPPSPEPWPAAPARDTIVKSTPSHRPPPLNPPQRRAPLPNPDPLSHPPSESEV